MALFIDRVEFFDLGTAKKKIKSGQEELIEEFAQRCIVWPLH